MFKTLSLRFSHFLVLLAVFSLSILVSAKPVQAQVCGAGPECSNQSVGSPCGDLSLKQTCQPAIGLPGLCECISQARQDEIKNAGIQPAGGAPVTGTAADQNPFGTIDAPPGVENFNNQAKTQSGGTVNIGIIIFVSNMIKLATILAGILVFFNFILAGFTYITSPGDSSAQNKMRDQITYSVLGLVLIVAAYTIIAVLSLIIFGRADYILNPEIVGPV
jgi:hypothetical protein